MRKLIAALALVVGLAAPAAASAGTQTFTAAADSEVQSANAGSNFGTSLKLHTDGSPVVRSYVKFNISGVTGPVQSAKLTLRPTSSLSGAVEAHATSSSWTESGITYGNAPAPGLLLASVPSVTSGIDMNFNVPVGGNGDVSFALLSSNTTALAMSSHENTVPPKLTVTWQDADTQPPTAPTGLSGTAGDGKVDLSWSASSDNVGVKGYRVFRDGTQIADLTGLSYSDSTATNGTTYSYTVKAYDAAGNVSAASNAVSETPQATPPPDVQPTFPVRGAFYYGWFPESWNQQGLDPFTKYHPSLGFYDSSSPSVVQNHIAAMDYGKINVSIASWWGQGTPTDGRISTFLAQTAQANSKLRWALYYEAEGNGPDPSVAQIDSDLTYIQSHYGTSPAYWRVGGKPVIFVYGDGADACGMADRWAQANAGRFYTVLKVFPGYSTCANQPSNWHQYAPAVAEDHQTGHAFGISPGFNKANEATPRLARDPARWNTNIKDMVASGEPLQLITTFNEWGEGSSVESATEWASASGFGTYLDALHNDGQGVTPPPAPQCSDGLDNDSDGKVDLADPGCTDAQDNDETDPPPAGTDPVIAAAGDISPEATSAAARATSDLLVGQNLAGVLTLGDNQYEAGALSAYNSFFDPTWGRVNNILHPTPGNHEYGTSGAAGYFSYFGSKGVTVGSSAQPYYSFDIGSWHFVSLNSEVAHGAGSAQDNWLKTDLAAHPAACTAAYWHKPFYSSTSSHGVQQDMQPLVQDLYNANADVVLQGHNHIYERFAPQNVSRVADSARGLRSFTVGTGGRSHYPIGTVAVNSEVRDASTFGVLKLTLHATSYDWRFVPAAGQGTFTDAGTQACH